MSKQDYPTPEDFLIKKPLYTIVKYEDDNLIKGKELINFDTSLDTYCLQCQKHSTFIRKEKDGHCSDINSWIDIGLFAINLLCTRKCGQKLTFIFYAKNKTIQKIGQLSSFADLNLYDTKKYSKVLEKKYLQELNKSIGLASHGIGVGSFVYLRRIFEFLIEETYQKAKVIEGWDDKKYQDLKMQDKIKILESQLPSFLVEYKNLYSILSKGIHQLSEDECLESFEIIKIGIEIILDEKIEQQNKEKKLKEASKALKNLSSKSHIQN